MAAETPQAVKNTPLRWYMAGQASWYFAFGMQFVLLAAIGILTLRIDAARFGVVQAALLAPALLFMLLGGVVAERHDCRSLLVRYHLLACLLPFLLSIALVTETLTFPGLVAYAFATGTVTAFVMPARDTILTRVAAGNIQRAVTLATGTQFFGQVVGMSVAGGAQYIGIAPFLMLHAVVVFIGAFIALQLPPRPAGWTPSNTMGTFGDIRDGLRLARKHSDIFPILIMMLAISMFYIGPFMILLPLFIRDIYDGNIGSISIVQVSFWSGTIIVSLLLFRVGHIIRRGRLFSVALSGGVIVLLLFSIPQPFWVMCALCTVWGVCAGTTMAMSRTIVQEHAPETHRARFLSIYQLCFLGGAPIGALLVGLLALLFELREIVFFPAMGMVATLAITLATTSLWRIGPTAPVQEVDSHS